MKEYPLTESELNELGGLQTSAAVAFAAGTGLLGSWFTVTQAIDFADKVAPTIVTKWQTYGNIALVAAVVAYIVGAFLRYKGKTRLGTIKRETIHG